MHAVLQALLVYLVAADLKHVLREIHAMDLEASLSERDG